MLKGILVLLFPKAFFSEDVQFVEAQENCQKTSFRPVGNCSILRISQLD